jgi:3-oxoacyl-[acyl-carrier protein] reductase
MSKYSDIRVGDKAEISHKLTKEDILKFVDLTGDDNKLHVDEEYAQNTFFKKPVVHGMLGASFISTVIGTKLPGDGALWFSQKLDFLLPVRVGDFLTIQAEVLEKFDRDNVIRLSTKVYNQDKQLVTDGEAKVKVVDEEVERDTEQISLKKVALVIGATGGIGQSICKRLLDAGFSLGIHYNKNDAQAQKMVEQYSEQGHNIVKVSGDLTNESEIKEMLKQVVRKLGNITVLINSATLKTPVISFADLEWCDFEKHLNLNVKANYSLVRHISPMFTKQKYGKIIMITTQSIETPNKGWLPYITAKSALNGFSKALAMELAPFNITVNMVSPGMTDTSLVADIPQKQRLLNAAKTPLRRLATPDDIAGSVVFLTSSEADYITGETIRVNGGQVMI